MTRLCAAALVLAAGLGGGELALRRAYGPDPAVVDRLFLDETRYLHAESGQPFFRKRGSGDSEVWTNARPRANPAEFPVAKPDSELRVIVAGESVAQRLGSSDLEDAL